MRYRTPEALGMAARVLDPILSSEARDHAWDRHLLKWLQPQHDGSNPVIQ